MLEYARWKYILIVLVLLLSTLFALPNVFGDDPAIQIERGTFPTLGKIIADQVSGVEPVAADAAIDQSYRDKLY